ncbi:ankyrin repeat-containing domain protein [Hypoxylon rubiginosum]|uniref:Ankyrin repeat-containing domain protein n=1 Tax=Hypoxylon rubiginosum TaxID=110542 RepID=A0ACB9YK99_9PEZI|nr:ankyrin repeat-containing domain protein [Hypoxylon rubiginosum]
MPRDPGYAAKRLIDNGEDVNANDPDHGTALCIATEKGHDEIFDVLLKNGADVNVTNKSKGTVLTLATTYGRQDLVDKLLQGGANVYGYATHIPLVRAASSDFRGIVSMLLDKGANINARDGYGDIAVVAAIIRGHEEIVKLLVNKGADINARDGHGHTAVIAAIIHGHEEIIKLLVNKAADMQIDIKGRALLDAIRHTQKGIVQMLLDMGADANPSTGNIHPLIAAVKSGRTDIVKLLLEKGADINAQGAYNPGEYDEADDYGFNDLDITALMAAVDGGHGAIVKILIKKGADLNIASKRYSNQRPMIPLQLALEIGSKSIIKMLREARDEEPIPKPVEETSGRRYLG